MSRDSDRRTKRFKSCDAIMTDYVLAMGRLKAAVAAEAKAISDADAFVAERRVALEATLAVEIKHVEASVNAAKAEAGTAGAEVRTLGRRYEVARQKVLAVLPVLINLADSSEEE